MMWGLPCLCRILNTKAGRTTSNDCSDYALDYCYLRRSPPAIPRVNASAHARNLIQDWCEQSLARAPHINA